MPSPRTRRLILDEQNLTSLLAGWPLIQISGKAGIPPEIYRFTYYLRGLYVAGSGEILERDIHVLEVNLSLGYPRRAPQCRMLTPVFHPNFDDSMVCIGDFWAASEGLDDLVIRIGRMISYQEYNTKSPLNGLAAKWAAQHVHLLPIDPRPIAPPLKAAQLAQPVPVEPTAVEPPPTEKTLIDPMATANPNPGPIPTAISMPDASVPVPNNPAPNANPSPSADPWSEKIVIASQD